MTTKGEKVQVFIPDNHGGYLIKKGIIDIRRNGGEPPNIFVLQREPITLKKVRHLDFMIKGKPFWCHRPRKKSDV